MGLNAEAMRELERVCEEKGIQYINEMPPFNKDGIIFIGQLNVLVCSENAGIDDISNAIDYIRNM